MSQWSYASHFTFLELQLVVALVALAVNNHSHYVGDRLKLVKGLKTVLQKVFLETSFCTVFSLTASVILDGIFRVVTPYMIP